MKILPIVVLYKCHISESKSINSLIDSDINNDITIFLVYDNSPGLNDSLNVTPIYRGRKVIYRPDNKNSGVSRAYNTGIKVARNLNFEFVILLDQDTLFPMNSMCDYIDILSLYPGYKLYAPRLITLGGEYCSPLKYFLNRGFTIDNPLPGEYSLKKYSPINSGVLLDVNSAIDCGGFNEEVYLDFSDFQFIDRLKKKTNDFYVMPLLLTQNLSNEEPDWLNLYTRYRIYCICALKCNRNNIGDDLIYFFMVLARGCKLTLRTKRLVFLKQFYISYIKGKE